MTMISLLLCIKEKYFDFTCFPVKMNYLPPLGLDWTPFWSGPSLEVAGGFVETINLIGGIDRDLFLTFKSEVDELELNSRVSVTLSSDGGDAYTAMAFFDYIQYKKSQGMYFEITGTGLVASAAVLVLAAGSNRYLTKNAWVMVHEDTTPVTKHQLVHQAEKDLKHSRLLEGQWCEILESVSTANWSIWTDLHRNETYLNPSDCKKLGLIEGIV